MTEKKENLKDKNNVIELHIIDKYYYGDKTKYMDDKEKYNDKINRLKELINKTKNRSIVYSEFWEIRELLDELGGIKKKDYNTMLKKYNFKFPTLYDNVVDDSNLSKGEQIRISEIIGTLSGTTMSIERKYVTNYEEFIRKIKKH